MQRIIANGVDITSYISSMRCARNDIDAPGSGRDMNGLMMRGRVAVKSKLEFSCRILTDAEVAALSAAVGTETVDVSYYDPYFGQRTASFYGSSIETAVWRSDASGTYWQGVSFNLIEV